jgi:hypothetical protein
MDNLRIPREDFAFHAHEDTRRGMFARMHLNLPADLMDNYILPMAYGSQDDYLLANRPRPGINSFIHQSGAYYHRRMNERERQFRQAKQHLEDVFPEFAQRYAPEPIRDQAPQHHYYQYRDNQDATIQRAWEMGVSPILNRNEFNQYRLPSGQVIEHYNEPFNRATMRYDYFEPDEENFDYYVKIRDDQNQGQNPLDTSPVPRYNFRDERI